MDVLGLDLGTSGVRGLVLSGTGVQTTQSVPIQAARRRDPAALWEAVTTVLTGLRLDRLAAMAVAGTSGTIGAVGRDGEMLGPLSLYSDPADPACVAAIAEAAPAGSPARGHTSPLGRALVLARRPDACRLLHEADWVAARLSGQFGVSDENNALKTGYDPKARAWPGLDRHARARAGPAAPSAAAWAVNRAHRSSHRGAIQYPARRHRRSGQHGRLRVVPVRGCQRAGRRRHRARLDIDPEDFVPQLRGRPRVRCLQPSALGQLVGRRGQQHWRRGARRPITSRPR